jgi:hypothetical protein
VSTRLLILYLAYARRSAPRHQALRAFPMFVMIYLIFCALFALGLLIIWMG